MRTCFPMLTMLMVLVFAVAQATASEAIAVPADGRVVVTLGSAVDVELVTADGYLLGIGQARIGGVDLRPEGYLSRPLVASEWGEDRTLGVGLRLMSAVQHTDGRLVLSATIMGSGVLDAYRSFYVMTGDRRAASESADPALETRRAAVADARAALAAAIEQSPGVVERLEQLAAAEAKLANKPNDNRAARDVRRANDRLTRARRDARGQVLADPALAETKAVLDDWTAQVNAVAIRDFGRLHRDFYRFPILRQPAEIATEAAQREILSRHADSLQPIGELTWTLTPVTEVVAGWPWQGWEQRVAVTLHDEHQLSVVYHLSANALGGAVESVVPVALRYRGLGSIEQPLGAAGIDGVATSFTTTEIIPGAAGGAPLVSPIVSSGAAVTDRGYGLRHRVGAWINRMARGAGAPFVDYQYMRADDGSVPAIVAGYPVRQGNLRAVTEAFPGDHAIGQIDEERFARGQSATTVPFRVLALVPEQAFARHEQLTRWQELDQHVRDLVSEELGFVQHEVLPGIHILHDHNHGPRISGVANSVPRLAAEGVKRIEVHGPGWINGRNRGTNGPPKVGGGDCSVYDYVPMNDAEQPWKDLQRAMAEHDMGYHIWVTGMVWGTAGFATDVVGLDPRHWAWNSPEDVLSETPSGYNGHRNINIRDETMAAAFIQRIEQTAADYGMQGFWADSFQNLFMSMLDWAAGDGAPLQRMWWEQISAWSRDGLAWTAESHAFPGTSCSIEVSQRFEDEWWFTQHVGKAYRADSWPDPGTPFADRLFFRFMANKGQAIPYLNVGKMPSEVVPSFARMATEFMAARPLMRRSWVLPASSGTLWCHFDDNTTGVWFPFADADVPAGVTAIPIGGGDAVTRVTGEHTYRVTASDLPQAFGMRAAPAADGRLGRTWTDPSINRPAFVAGEEVTQ